MADSESSSGTRQALLAAGGRLFARKGYEGTSVREITGEAGANLGAVTYHFGSKEALYRTVISARVEPWLRRVREAMADEGPADDRMEAAVDALLGALQDDPAVPSLLFQRVTAGQAPPPPVDDALRELVRGLAGVVRQGKSEGTLEAGDPVLAGAGVLAQLLGIGLLRRALAPGGEKGLLGRSDAGLRSHLREVVRRSLS